MNYRRIIPIYLTFYCLFSSFSSEASEKKKSFAHEDVIISPEEMPDYMLEKLKKDPFVKEHFGWKLAFCQHPMYLLIDEDRGEPTVGERAAHA